MDSWLFLMLYSEMWGATRNFVLYHHLLCYWQRKDCFVLFTPLNQNQGNSALNTRALAEIAYFVFMEESREVQGFYTIFILVLDYYLSSISASDFVAKISKIVFN